MRIRTATRNLGQPSAYSNPDSCYRQLACAMVLQALKESARGDEGARAWLLSEGLSLMDLVGINITSYQEVVRLIEQRADPAA